MKSIPSNAPDMTGTQYDLQGLLGEGGFGSAYLTFDRKLRRKVVLKFLQDTSNAGFVARFQREAQVMAGLGAEAIPGVFEISATPKDGIPFIAMEFIDGKMLADHLYDEGGALPQEEACRIVADAAAGLAMAHEAGVVHRDIKLANILIDKKKRVKIIDFGIARMTIEESREATPKMLTRKNELLGTPRYMSPEQCRAEGAGPASDLYSLGVVLFMLLTGGSPFDGNNHEMMLGHVTKQAPKLADIAGRPFPAWLERIVAQLLEKDPNARFADGNELAAALRGAARVPRDASMTRQAFDERTGKPLELSTTGSQDERISAPVAQEPSNASPTAPVVARRATQLQLGDSVRALAREPSVFVAPISGASDSIRFDPTLAAAAAPPTIVEPPRLDVAPVTTVASPASPPVSIPVSTPAPLPAPIAPTRREETETRQPTLALLEWAAVSMGLARLSLRGDRWRGGEGTASRVFSHRS